MADNKLVVLRGPSGAGKSTVAKALQKGSSADILIIEQDYYRHTLLADKPDTKNIVPEMLYMDTLIALRAGYTVIAEGIFRKEKYLPTFQRLAKDFDGRTRFYYFDIPFDETVNRHSTRPKAELFSAIEMKEWYSMAEPLGIKGEQLIGQEMSKDEIVALVQKQIAES